MIRSDAVARAAGLCIGVGLALGAGHATSAAETRAFPMQFERWTEGPAQLCGNHCRVWVSATGTITAETPKQFEAFAARHKLQGATIAFNSDGGAVLGALALGRSIRNLGMITTVGKTVDLSANEGGKRRARLLPKASCESMCAFVLLAGERRHIPGEALVMVHQIWLGDRREDPTAAHYSAEDLAVVQRDIGRLAQYTVEMGGGIELLEIALRIPPWEPMRPLSRAELHNMKIEVIEHLPGATAASATNSVATAANGARARVDRRGWAMLADSKVPTLSRGHPLTVEGEEIGVFDLQLGCGEQGGDYVVTYIERRHGGVVRRNLVEQRPSAPMEVELIVSGRSLPLKIASSLIHETLGEIHTVASGRLPAKQLKAFAIANGRSLAINTTSDDFTSAIRVGNTGMAQALPQLISRCANQPPIRSAMGQRF